WQKFWLTVEEPWRPNKNDIRFCEEMIKMVKKNEKYPKALVMGSTPEIRDMLAKHKIETTLVDVNPSMKKAMDRLMKRKNRHEKLIVSNWLDVKLPINYFDLAFSDGCLTNIALSTWKIFFKNINRALKYDGFFYSGSWIYQVKKPLSFDGIIKKYKEKPAYFKSFKNRILALHSLVYEQGFYNRKKKEYDFFKVVARLEEYVKRGVISENDLKNIKWSKVDIGPYIEIAFDDIKEHDDYIKKFYKIIKIFQDKSHPLMAFRRDYILMKK
ncbi:MAG TPA: class I SAM-dependent methyltransferase, partial [Patescibacteria group bacterium]|nr:class I SAM-dependent methyltransferase [Patescibacteria group bacterium]